jgi:hypothetical protein
MRSYYPGITLFKLMGCLLVVAAHVMLLRYLELLPGQAFVQFSSLTMRIIVPCFYVISGFLAFRGWNRAASARSYIKRYTLRIGMIYLFFFAFFIMEHIIPAFVSGGLGWGNLLLQAKIIAVALFLNGPFVQFWFIPPLLFGVWAAWLLLRSSRTSFSIALLLFAFTIIQFISGTFKEWSFIPQEGYIYEAYLIPFLTRYIGFGFVFVLAGALAAKHAERFMQIRAKRWLGWTLLLMAGEIMLLFKLSHWTTDYKLTFSVLPGTLLLFYGILRINSGVVERYHREISLFSMVTFFGHIGFMRINLILLGWSSDTNHVWQDIAWLLLTLGQCAAVAFVIIRFADSRVFAKAHKKIAS